MNTSISSVSLLGIQRDQLVPRLAMIGFPKDGLHFKAVNPPSLSCFHQVVWHINERSNNTGTKPHLLLVGRKTERPVSSFFKLNT